MVLSKKFLTDFDKTISKVDGVAGSSQPPRYWYTTGNYALNRIISGSFFKGIPQGRVTTLTGPSSSGKSFVTGNLVREAQKAGAYILVIDSENALDDDFMEAIGVDVENNYNYKSVTTIAQVQKVVSSFLKGYRSEYGNDEDAPQVLICIDSLSMLLTETELANYDKGVQKGDQGQRNKQLKAMLRAFVQDIKDLNVAILNTAQVYKNQDVLNGEGVWIVPDAVKYSASQIVMLTKLKLKETGSRVVEGIKMKCEGYKTRFTKPFQTVTIMVPYETGMNPHSGLIDAFKSMEIISQAGSWYKIVGTETKFQEKNIENHVEDLLVRAEAQSNAFLEIDESVEEENEKPTAASKRRKKKVTGDD